MNVVSYHRQIVTPYLRARWGRRGEAGASHVEYALLVVLIAAVCLLAVTLIGQQGEAS